MGHGGHGGGHGHHGGGFGPGNFGYGYGYGYPGGYDDGGDVIVVVPPPAAPIAVAPCKSSFLHKCPQAVGDYTVGGYSLTTVAVAGVGAYLLYRHFRGK